MLVSKEYTLKNLNVLLVFHTIHSLRKSFGTTVCVKESVFTHAVEHVVSENAKLTLLKIYFF